VNTNSFDVILSVKSRYTGRVQVS